MPENKKYNSLERWAGSDSTTLALVFTDIVDSTGLCNKLGDAEWTKMLIKHFRQARSLLCQYRCYEIKIIGDSFMVVFRTAVEALKFSMAFHDETGHDLIKIRAGIHVGAVRVIENDIYGGMVNYCSRVASASENSAIILSNTAKEQIEVEMGREKTNDLVIQITRTFKGFPNAQTLWIANAEVWWKNRIKQAFPICNGEPISYYTCTVEQATFEDVEWLAELESRTYSVEDAIPETLMRDWFKRNPNCFSVIKNNGVKIGHIDILPLHEETASVLFQGKIRDREIKATGIYAPAEKHLVKIVYIESVVIEPDGQLKIAAITALLNSFASLIEKISDGPKLDYIYAIAASKGGERFMQQLGFQLEVSENRIDGHHLYAAKYADIIVNIKNILG